MRIMNYKFGTASCAISFQQEQNTPPTHTKDRENEINHSLEMWFKIENYSVAIQMRFAKFEEEKKYYPPFLKKEREKERTRIQQGSLSVTSTFVQW